MEDQDAQLTLLDIEPAQAPSRKGHGAEQHSPRDPKLRANPNESLFKASGFRHNGLEEDKLHPCLKCEESVCIRRRTFCDDCKATDIYRFAGAW